MTRFRDVKLGDFRQYQNTRTIFQKKNMGQCCFTKRSKLQKFKLSSFTLTWSNEEKVNNVRPYVTYSKELQQKLNMLDKFVLKKHLN